LKSWKLEILKSWNLGWIQSSFALGEFERDLKSASQTFKYSLHPNIEFMVITTIEISTNFFFLCFAHCLNRLRE
jgi:hypothetical protein